MAFFLIGRGADDALQLLSANAFDSRQDAMAELSRITSDSGFAHWDLEVFVVDLDAGVPVLLVRPRGEGGVNAPTVAEEAEAVASDESVPAASAEASAPPEETEAAASEAVCDETSTDLREALQRTAEQMSAEGIIPPPSAGLSPEPEAGEEAEGESTDDVESVDEASVAPESPKAPEGAPAGEGETAEEPAEELAEEGAQAQELSAVVREGGEDQSWPWDAAPAAPAAESSVSPEIATVYQGLEQMEEQEVVTPPAAPAADAQSVGSDFILDLEAIQPVAMQPQGTDAASPPTQPSETPPAADPAETPPAEEPSGEPSGDAGFPSSMTEYTCEDCVYVETCPNRDQREPKDCGSFQWK